MNKYNNKKTEYNGILFDSKAEMRRFQELKLLEKAGEIKDLVLQPKFELVPKMPGERAVTYTADFMYIEKERIKKCDKICENAPFLCDYLSKSELCYRYSGIVVEDTKSVATAKNKEYILKRKLFKSKYPHIEFREVVM